MANVFLSILKQFLTIFIKSANHNRINNCHFLKAILLHNYQCADVSSMAAVETVGCKYGSFVTNNITVVVVSK